MLDSKNPVTSIQAEQPKKSSIDESTIPIKGKSREEEVKAMSSLSNIFNKSFPTEIPNGNKFSCNTCHTNGGGTPRNAFGLDVKKNLSGNNINWAALSKLDSDGDGFTNGVELQDPDGTWTPASPQPGDLSKVTNPGDKNSVPTTVENEYNRINKIISNFKIYPNPIISKFQISFDLKLADFVSINIYNYEGNLIQTIYNGYLNEGFNLLNFNNNLLSGVYLIGIKTNNVLLFDKIVAE